MPGCPHMLRHALMRQECLDGISGTCQNVHWSPTTMPAPRTLQNVESLLHFLMQICSTSLSVSRLQRGKPWRSVEAVQARGLNHPGIVRTYKTTTVLVQVSSARSMLPC
jgi:hypothetical protein